jgi:hypothetical protein
LVFVFPGFFLIRSITKFISQFNEDELKSVSLALFTSGQNLSLDVHLSNNTCKNQKISFDTKVCPVEFKNKMVDRLGFLACPVYVVIDEAESELISRPIERVWNVDPSEASQELVHAFYQNYFQKDASFAPWIFVKIYEPLIIEGIVFLNDDVDSGTNELVVLSQGIKVKDCDIYNVIKEVIPERCAVLEIKDKDYTSLLDMSCSSLTVEVKKNFALNLAEGLRRLNRKNRSAYELNWSNYSSLAKELCLKYAFVDELLRPHILYKRYSNKYSSVEELNEELKVGSQSANSVLAYYDQASTLHSEAAFALACGIDPVELGTPLDYLFAWHEEKVSQSFRHLKVFVSFQELLTNQFQASDNGEHELAFEKSLISLLGTASDKTCATESRFSISFVPLGSSAVPMMVVLEERSRRVFLQTRQYLRGRNMNVSGKIVVNKDHDTYRIFKESGADAKAKALIVAAMFYQAYRCVWLGTCSPKIIVDR